MIGFSAALGLVRYKPRCVEFPSFSSSAVTFWLQADDRISLMRLLRCGLNLTQGSMATWWPRTLPRSRTGSAECSEPLLKPQEDTFSSVVLQVKFKSVAIRWPESEASKVEAYVGGKLPGAVCGGRSRSWAQLRLYDGVTWLLPRTLLEPCAWKVVWACVEHGPRLLQQPSLNLNLLMSLF